MKTVRKKSKTLSDYNEKKIKVYHSEDMLHTIESYWFLLASFVILACLNKAKILSQAIVDFDIKQQG